MWIDTPNGHSCPRHNQDFLRGETCSRCVTDPGDEIGAAATSEDLDLEILADAARYSSNAKRMWREASNLLAGTAQDKSTAGKLSDCAIKWERLNLEAKDKVAARKHLRDAMQHERDMSTSRGPH